MGTSTLKGWGLKMAAAPGNHSALLQAEEMEELRQKQGLKGETGAMGPEGPRGPRGESGATQDLSGILLRLEALEKKTGITP